MYIRISTLQYWAVVTTLGCSKLHNRYHYVVLTGIDGSGGSGASAFPPAGPLLPFPAFPPFPPFPPPLEAATFFLGLAGSEVVC